MARPPASTAAARSHLLDQEREHLVAAAKKLGMDLAHLTGGLPHTGSASKLPKTFPPRKECAPENELAD